MSDVVVIVLDDDDDEEGPSPPSEKKKSPARAPPPAEVKKSPARAPPSLLPLTVVKQSPGKCLPLLREVKKSPARASPPPPTEAEKSPARASPPSPPPPTEANKCPAGASPPSSPSPPPPTEVQKSPAKACPSPHPPPSSEQQGKAKKDKSQNKAALSEENKKLFEEFVEYCSKLTSDNPEVIAYLQGRYDKANPDYLSTVEFRNTIGRCLSRVQSKQTKVYVYINELCTVLKAHTAKKRLALKPQAPPQTTQNATEEAGTSNENAEANEEVTEMKTASKRQIRYLENLLRLYSQEIQKLQERELSLDDLADEDSTYIQESRLKRKLLRIFEKLCELKDCSSLTGRVIEQRIQYKGTRYPEINRRLEKFINKERDVFPDYSDVFQVVQRTNDKHSLGLARKQMQSMAQDAFRELGNKLQDRRHLDMVYNFGCHLTDVYKNGNDPAFQDTSLARRLRDNRSTAVNRLEDIIKKYAEMQDDGEDQGWKNNTRSSEQPSTSKDVKVSQMNQETSSSESEDDEDSEESDVDIEEELKQSEQAVDGEEDEETLAEEGNEVDQKMEEQERTDISQNPSPAGKEEGEQEQGNDDEKNGEEPMEEGADEEPQESPLSSTSLSSEKESANVSLESEGDTMHSASPGNSNDAPPVGEKEEECAEQQEDNATPCVTSHEPETRSHSEGQPEISLPADDLMRMKESDAADVPYMAVETPAEKEQDAGKCTDAKDDSLTDSKSPMNKKDARSGRLDQCINKLVGGVKRTAAEKETPPPSPSTQIMNEKPCAESTPKVKPNALNSNGKLVCVDTPANSRDPVRKIAFSHSQSVDSSTDVLHLDTGKESTHSIASNGVHRALVRPATPVNRLKLRPPIDTPRDTIQLIKLEKQSPPSRKRKGSPQMWIRNGVNKCNGSENGDEQMEEKDKRAKLDCSSASASSPSEAGSDNEHDLTLDMMVTCSPTETPVKAPGPYKNKVDASTQCDPDEVIVLSD